MLTGAGLHTHFRLKQTWQDKLPELEQPDNIDHQTNLSNKSGEQQN